MEHKTKKIEIDSETTYHEVWTELETGEKREPVKTLEIENKIFSLSIEFFQNDYSDSFCVMNVKMKESEEELSLYMMMKKKPTFYALLNDGYSTDEVTGDEFYLGQKAYKALKLINSVK
jgi:hypothetical protein